MDIQNKENEGARSVSVASVSPDANLPLGKLLTIAAVVALMAISIIGFYYSDITLSLINSTQSFLGPDFQFFFIAGLVAQLIDGALGMAYGVSASTALMSFGVPPAAASASIHTAEIFTSGVSGIMHLKFKNINKKLFKSLLLPGVLGAIAGALVLSFLEQYNYIIKPIVAVYTLILGVIILRKAYKKTSKRIKTDAIPRLASFGGFMDSLGGGGWGPIVSSTLIAGGRHPRYTIGSVNSTEFFVALASSITFLFVIGINHWNIIVGLILGGIVAAPIAAFIAQKLRIKTMMIVVGILVIALSCRIIYMSLF